MKKRWSGSTQDGDESSPESDAADTDFDARTDTNPSTLTSRSSSAARSRRPSTFDWKLPSNGRDGYPTAHSLAVNTTLSHSTLAISTPLDLDMPPAKGPLPAGSGSRRSGLWSISVLALLTAACGLAILSIILRSLVTHQIDPKGCRMSYMRPSYTRFAEFDTEHTRFATKYSLYLYREQGIDGGTKVQGIPVLFIPGNAGSYKQVRPIAAEAANYFHHDLQHDGAAVDSGVRNLDFFTVDFNEDITAFHGQTMLDQAEYLNEAVRYILSLYTDPQRASRASDLPDPTSVIVLGHSMGGIVARTMLVQPNYQANSINTIITMSAPHARPPVTFDGQIVQIYDEINDYWRRAYSEKWANNNPLWHVTLVSIAGGSLDTVVPSDYASLESLVPETHGFTVFTTGIPTIWTSMDHLAILWCDQFRKVISRTLYDIVDVHRASQTKPRADRMRIFKKRFLTGLEPDAEKSVSHTEATTLLTLGKKLDGVVPAGERLVLTSVGERNRPKAHLLPVPQASSERQRFTLLTDSHLDEAGESGQLEVLLCGTLPLQVGSGSSLYTSIIDLSGEARDPKDTTRLACKSAAPDLVLLPASTKSTRYPFYLERERETHPFSYLQYDLEHLSDYKYVVVVEKPASKTRNFVIAEFSDQADFHQASDIGLSKLLTLGLSVKMPATHPMAVEISVPSLKSALFAYHLEVTTPQCNGNGNGDLFAPLVRQHLERPYESKYFVNAELASISLHGVAPYVPPPLEARDDSGLAFDLWVDPTCDGELHINLRMDAVGSLGKLYMRYRTVFAAFPLLIVTLVLRKQFRVYDDTGVFISFSDSLDLSLRQSVPLLLLSLTLLSMSVGGGTSVVGSGLEWNWRSIMPYWTATFHRNDLLIGTEDPYFWFLVPLIGIVCIGVCTALHCATLGLNQLLAVLYGLFRSAPPASVADDRQRAPSPAAPLPGFGSSTPRRRMITTAVLLFLVSTFIPYQFAYLVACLVQLFTTVRALRMHSNVPSATNANYYHYAHSILLLMLWVLPINLPILAVWVRNLAVHWLTPFSSHHNVLSIMPFILLVENLTTGRMVPRVTTNLRFVTSILLFGTALCAAVYGVSHAYMLHYFVNVVAAWLVVIHSTSDSWSLTGLRAMFEGHASEVRKRGKTP